MEKTLAIIKPDAFERGIIGKVISKIEEKDLSILTMKVLWLSKKEAEGFYKEHAERPFFHSLTNFMSSGKVVVIVLEGINAISRWRELMGATNPEDAKPGTIRAELAVGLEKNSVHGSDSASSADRELSYFFNTKELAE